MNIRIFETLQDLFHAAAQEFIRSASDAIQKKGTFTAVLSGGSTPKGLFSLMTQNEYRDQIPWNQIHFFWGDERHVPPDHSDSNFKMASDAMLSKVSVPASNIHRIKSELDSSVKAAEEYETLIQPFLPFDLVFLGMGNDGHTASLFPGTKALHESKKGVVSNWVGKFNTDRITMTAPVLNAASTVLFLVSGADKTLPLKAVLEGPREPDQLPSQLIRPASGNLLWFIEKAAAQLLSS